MPAGGKVLLVKGATGRDGVVDQAKVKEWAEMYTDSNVGLRADGWIGIDVDAYDGKSGDKTLEALEAELGELPVTISSTSRGPEQPSRIHFYRIPDPNQRFITKFPDVEIIQRSHRYAIVFPSRHPDGENREYLWYGYEGEVLEDLPAIDDLEELPEAWLERLSLPDFEVDEGAGYSGSVAEWLERIPQGSPGLFLQAKIDEIPRGDFGHDVMVSLVASMVTLAARGEPGAKQALATLRREWLRGPYDTDEYRRAYDAALESAVAKFGAVPDRPEDVLTTDQVAAAIKVKNPDFIDLWMGLPQVITEDSLRERVARLMSIAFDEGLSPLEAASLGWHSSAAQHAEHGIRQAGLQSLWDLMVHVAENPVGTEAKFLPEPDAPKPEAPALLPHRGVELLTQDEVARRANLRWWGDEFMEEMRSMHSLLSDQYYHLNRWVILSLCFSAYAVIPFDDGNEVPLNIYGGALGPSRSGKTEAVRPVKEIPRRFWDLQFNGHSPDIGGDATKQALATKLLEKSGLPTLFRADEAQSVLRAWADMNGPFSGVKAFVTNVYDGEASAFLRQGQKEDSGKEARVFLSIHFTGIDEEVADAITPEDWRSGAVNRFVWARGQRKTPNREQKRLRVLNGGEKARGTSGQSWYQQWASEFSGIAARVFSSTTPDTPYYMEVAEDVLDRHIDTGETFEKIAQNGPYRDRLEPAFDRLGMTILKCAALVAITKDRRRIEMDDYIIALEQAEEWAENLMFMVEATDESPRARQANRLYATIEREGGRMSEKKLKRMKGYAGDAKYVNGLIVELIEQGRAERLTLPDGNVIRVTKEGQ